MARRVAESAVLLLLSITAFPLYAANGVTDTAPGRARLEGRLLVRVRADAPASEVAAALTACGARRVGEIAAIGVIVAEVPEAAVASAERRLRGAAVVRGVERDELAHIAELPNDTYFPIQWGLTNVFAPEAWTVSTGAGALVAVLDTGIDASHPDLQGQVVAGYDFVNGDADPADDHGHGTRMAGIIAALANNGEGIAGLAPEAQLLAVKVLDVQGYGAYSDIASGIVFAADNGARVLNLSLSGAVESAVLQDAVDYAASRGAIVVAAAGNDGWDFPSYPAAIASVVAVSAVDAANAHTAFSNFGPWIDVAAPGVDIATTSTAHGYDLSSGTSPAAAFASATLALLLAAEPALTRDVAIARVNGSALDLGTKNWDRYYGWGLVDAYGALVPGHTPPAPDSGPPDVAIATPMVGSLLSGTTPVEVTATDDLLISRVELFVDDAWQGVLAAPPYVFSLDAAALAPGKHRLRAIAYDGAGHSGRSRVLRLFTTAGQGMLLTRAVGSAERLSLTGMFALPAGTLFDPRRDALEVTVSTAVGTTLAFAVAPGSMGGFRGRTFEATLAPDIPSGGTIRLQIANGSAPGVYGVRVRASRLSGGSAPAADMHVALTVGGLQLSDDVVGHVRSAP